MIYFISESECKKTWLNLRESHRRTIKKRKTKSGQAATTTKKWTYEDEMSFLLPHYKERSTISSVTDVSGDDDHSDVSSFLNDGSQNSINDIQSPETEEQQTPTPTSRPKSSASSITPNIPKKPKKGCAVENTSASHALMKYLIEEKKNKEEDDEIDKYFKSIAATVKKFSEYNQAVIKAKIYNAVSEIELKEIADKQNYYSFSNSYIPQRPEYYMPQGYNTLNNNNHESLSVPTSSRMQTQTGASNTHTGASSTQTGSSNTDFDNLNFEKNNN